MLEFSAFLTKTPFSGTHNVIGHLRNCVSQENSSGFTTNE
ncbi:hypothetical protein OkiPb00451_51250 [Escherichia coli]